jgi:hypothetical protein
MVAVAELMPKRWHNRPTNIWNGLPMIRSSSIDLRKKEQDGAANGSTVRATFQEQNPGSC